MRRLQPAERRPPPTALGMQPKHTLHARVCRRRLRTAANSRTAAVSGAVAARRDPDHTAPLRADLFRQARGLRTGDPRGGGVEGHLPAEK